MNPNETQPGFELPPIPSSEAGQAQSAEQTPQPERAPSPPAVPAPAQSQPMAPPQTYVPPALPAQDPAASTSPAVAEDADLIEKEWVLKAKQIVAATKEDPYTQNKELSRFKADYLKKRYNKDIKVEES